MPARKTLAEAAKELLSQNVSTKEAQGEKFGAGADRSYAKNPLGDKKDLGGVDFDPVASQTGADFQTDGIKGAENAGPKGPNFPGAKPPVGSEGMHNIKTGGESDLVNKKRAKVNDSGIVTEEDDDDGKKDMKEGKTFKDSKNSKDNRKDKENSMTEEGIQMNTDHSVESLGKSCDTTGGGSEGSNLGIPNAQPVSARVKSYFAKKTGNSDLTESFGNLFDGAGLSEEFKQKVMVVFEAAVISRATEICEAVEDEYTETLGEVYSSLKEEMTTKIDDYLNYMVEEWIQENQVAVETGLRSQLAEDFIQGLHSLFVEHYIDVPEDKVNVVEELASKVEGLEGRLNEEVSKNINLSKTLNEFKKYDAINSLSEGLTKTQFEKLVQLSEGLGFTSEKEFTNSVKILKETHFPKTVAAGSTSKPVQLNEESVEGDERGFVEEKVLDARMAGYTKALGRMGSTSGLIVAK